MQKRKPMILLIIMILTLFISPIKINSNYYSDEEVKKISLALDRKAALEIAYTNCENDNGKLAEENKTAYRKGNNKGIRTGLTIGAVVIIVREILVIIFGGSRK